MTFDTVVLMKKSKSAKRINSPVELSKEKDIKYGVVKDGFTENFFKSTRTDQFYRNMYAKMDKRQLPQTSEEGVRKVQNSDGKYAFMIDSTTADYWVNKKPCNLYSFRLGSALECHKYAFAVNKESSTLQSQLDDALEHLKSNGELERLKAKWWPHECSAAAAARAFGITQLNVLLVIVGTVIASRLM